MGWLKEQREKPSYLATHLSESTCEQLAAEHERHAEGFLDARTGTIDLNAATSIVKMSFNATMAVAHATLAVNYRLRIANGEGNKPGDPLPTPTSGA